MYTRPDALPYMVNIRATMFDQTGWYAPFIETFTREKLSFAETGAPHSFDEFPTVEDIERLTPAFEKEMGRSA